LFVFFFFQAEDGIRDFHVTGVQTCALPIFDRRAPGDVRDVVAELRADPAPLADALAGTPSTFLHGDWKLGNIGVAGDGRTVLLRSEERRVGKERRSRGLACESRKRDTKCVD